MYSLREGFHGFGMARLLLSVGEGRMRASGFSRFQKRTGAAENPRDYVVLTHAFTKNTSKVPEEQIRKALKCRDDVLSRFKKGEALDDSFPR
jgi:hypothetical protein